MFMRWNRPDSEPPYEARPIPSVDLPVAPDWEALVDRADKMAAVVDQHLEYESALQGRELTVGTLCPDQKASLVSDLSHLTHD